MRRFHPHNVELENMPEGPQEATKKAKRPMRISSRSTAKQEQECGEEVILQRRSVLGAGKGTAKRS